AAPDQARWRTAPRLAPTAPPQSDGPSPRGGISTRHL
ncbi:MAG: hypothetical protein AVDCRST_MAG44-1415, partial [uncultured Sphingomonas sp.]